MVEIILRADPSKARDIRERIQADEIYRTGTTLRVRAALKLQPSLLTNMSRSLCLVNRRLSQPFFSAIATMLSLVLTVLLETSLPGLVRNLSPIRRSAEKTPGY